MPKHGQSLAKFCLYHAHMVILGSVQREPIPGASGRLVRSICMVLLWSRSTRLLRCLETTAWPRFCGIRVRPTVLLAPHLVQSRSRLPNRRPTCQIWCINSIRARANEPPSHCRECWLCNHRRSTSRHSYKASVCRYVGGSVDARTRQRTLFSTG